MANLDLDIQMNGMENDILNKSKGIREDIYPRVLNYAYKKGVSISQVNDVMLNVAGNYSNITDEEINKMAEDYCEKQYEECLKKVSGGDFGDCGTQLPSCKKKFVEDYKKKELRKSKSGAFWGNVFQGINKISDMAKDYSTTTTGQNLREGMDAPNTPTPDTEVKILGMKPLVFTFVALGTVITLALATVMLTRKTTK